jgi:hypothetical protein
MKWARLKRRRWQERMAAEFQFHLDSQISDYVRRDSVERKQNCAPAVSSA